MNEISFPALGLQFDINPVAFSILGKDIYWYGIIIAIGLVLALYYAINETKKYNSITADNIYDVVLLGVPSALIGARIYYVIFSLDTYYDQMSHTYQVWDMFKIWKGGIAIYGALIGAVISTLIYCRLKKINWTEIFDICAPGLLIGQAIGRWGNFTNGEAFGDTANSFFLRMNIHIESATKNINVIGVHPTFLYESLWNVIGFILIFVLKKYKRFSGEIFLWYVMWYGTGRAWIEGLRADSLYIGGIRASQLLSIIAVAVCIVILIKNRRKKENLI